MAIDFIKTSRTAGPGKIGLVDNGDVKHVIDLAFHQGLNHVVQKSKPETLREVRASRVMSQHPDLFMKCPISTILNPRSAGEECEKTLTSAFWTISKHGEKAGALDGVNQLFSNSGLNQSLRDDVVLTADEFICNVLFNASQPNGVNTKDLRETVLSSQVTLRYPAIVRIGSLGGDLVISCRDDYGTLEPKRVLERLHLCSQKGSGTSINFSDQGTAGIGSYMVFCACTSFYMAVQPGKFSQFCATFPTKTSARNRSKTPKNLHWIKY